MVIATNPREEYDFVLEEDRALEPDKRTTWKILALDVTQRAHLEDGRATGTLDEDGEVSGFSVRTGTTVLECLRAGLRGCSNFCDADGAEVPFEKGSKRLNVLGRNVSPPTDDFLGRIHPNHRKEIASAIERNTRVTAKEGNG